MTIFSEDKQSRLVFEHIDSQGNPHPALCFHVHVHTPQFSGEMGKLWFEWEGVTHFMAGLQTLERTHKGSVRLESMSSDEFALEIYSLNVRGNLAARFRFAGRVAAANALFPYEFHAGFPIDPVELPILIGSLSLEHQRLSA